MNSYKNSINKQNWQSNHSHFSQLIALRLTLCGMAFVVNGQLWEYNHAQQFYQIATGEEQMLDEAAELFSDSQFDDGDSSLGVLPREDLDSVTSLGSVDIATLSEVSEVEEWATLTDA